MTKRGIEESLASSAFAGTASPQTMNGNGSAAATLGAAHMAGVLDPSLIMEGNVAAAAAAAEAYGVGYAQLSGVLDPTMMPNMKKIKLDHHHLLGESMIPTIHSGGGSTSTSPNSSSSSGTSSTVPVIGVNGGAKSGSRVVHIRNVPSDTTSADLYTLAGGFGRITQHLLCKNKGQAFVEFESPASATQMATYWYQTASLPTHMQPTIRGRHVQCQLSNHKELKNNFHNTPSPDSVGHHNNNNNVDYQHDVRPNGVSNGDSSMHSNSHTTNTPSPVIRVVVENMLYGVTLESLYTIFTRAGKVHKIVTFTKNNVFQALVQFADITQAIQAKLSLDGAHMFSGGANTLRVEYSKLQNLIVKYNNEKSRDYTNQSLGSGGSSAGAFAGVSSVHSAAAVPASVTSSMNGIGGASAEVNAVSDLNTLLAAAATGTPSALQALGTPFGASHFATNGHLQLQQRYATAAGLGNAATLQQALMTNAALSAGLVTPAGMLAASAAAGAGLTGLVLSPVIHVSGLSTEHTTPDALFTLFGVYGDVVRVKILFNKKDTALIQMAEPTQAHLAISHLDRTRLHGKTLRVTTSKHQVVQMPKEGHQDSGLTKDYTNSPLHRFKRPGSKNYNNIYPPSETLHVSNIPNTVSDEELKGYFVQETGKEIAKFKFFPNDRRMALVQFHCIEDSILALIKMHNYKVAEHSHLRVSFSKSPV